MMFLIIYEFAFYSSSVPLTSTPISFSIPEEPVNTFSSLTFDVQRAVVALGALLSDSDMELL